MSCKLTTWQLLQRRQYLKYQGLASVSINSYPYVLSATVPLSKYWVVWWLSLIVAPGVAVNLPYEVIIIPNGVTPPLLAAGSNPDDVFFANYKGTAGKAYGPGAYGLRVDKFNLGSTGAFDAPSNPGDECQMFDRPIIVGPGETLMGWLQQYAAGPASGAKLEMRMVVTQMDQTENLPLRF